MSIHAEQEQWKGMEARGVGGGRWEVSGVERDGDGRRGDGGGRGGGAGGERCPGEITTFHMDPFVCLAFSPRPSTALSQRTAAPGEPAEQSE